jgi:transcriptional regulator with XRE-family HTH domain
MKESQNRIIKAIQKRLKSRGETAEKLAFGAEISKSTISRLLAGKLNPTVRLLDKIADYFEIDIKDLFN